jgi:hypothetical protein
VKLLLLRTKDLCSVMCHDVSCIYAIRNMLLLSVVNLMKLVLLSILLCVDQMAEIYSLYMLSIPRLLCDGCWTTEHVPVSSVRKEKLLI